MLKTTDTLVLVDIQKGISKKNNEPYCFVKFANPKTYENFTVSALDQTVSGQPGDNVHATFHIRERFNNTQLVLKSINKAG